jgi:hypothetical protein
MRVGRSLESRRRFSRGIPLSPVRGPQHLLGHHILGVTSQTSKTNGPLPSDGRFASAQRVIASHDAIQVEAEGHAVLSPRSMCPTLGEEVPLRRGSLRIEASLSSQSRSALQRRRQFRHYSSRRGLRQ